MHSCTASTSESSMSVELLGRQKPRLRRIVPFFILFWMWCAGLTKNRPEERRDANLKMWKKIKGALGASTKHWMSRRFLIHIHEHGYIILPSHATIPLLPVLSLNRQAISWESSLHKLVRDIISFLTFTLLCFRVLTSQLPDL